MKSEILPYASDHFITHYLSSGQVLADLQEGLERTKISKYMLILTFCFSGDHFRSFFPILSVEELNSAAREGEKSHSNMLKYRKKMRIAEFGTPFA